MDAKKILHTFCLRQNIPPPMYETKPKEMEGQVSQFESTVSVIVGDRKYTSTPGLATAKKKAEQQAALFCIDELESKYSIPIKPEGPPREVSFLQECVHGLTDPRNEDSIELMRLVRDPGQSLPLVSLLFIKKIQSAVNKQDQSLSKSPQATFSHLLRTLSSSDNVLLPPLSEASCTSPPLTPMTEMENPASQQPLMHVVGAPSSSRVRINPIAINTTFADLLAETTSSALHGNESRENALQLVYIPATALPDSGLLLMDTEIFGRNCLEMLEEIRKLLDTDSITMSAPFKTPAILRDLKIGDLESCSTQKAEPASYTKSNGGAKKVSTDSLCTQHSETPAVLDEECIEERSEKMRLAQTPDTSRVSQEYWRQKKGARLFMPASPEGLPRNEVCTWLLGAPCYGNAFFAFVEPTEMNDVSTRTLMQVIAVHTPLGLLSPSSAVLSPLVRIPSKKYLTGNFRNLGIRNPSTVLTELLSKRVGSGAEMKVTHDSHTTEPNVGGTELGEGEIMPVKSFKSFSATSIFPSSTCADFQGLKSIYTSDEHPSKADASQAANMQVIHAIQRRCEVFLDRLCILSAHDHDRDQVRYSLLRSSRDADKHEHEDLDDSRYPLMKLTLSCDSQIAKDSESLRGFHASDDVCYFVGLGYLSDQLERALLRVDTASVPTTIRVGGVRVPLWHSNCYVNSNAIPASMIPSIGDIVSTAMDVDVTLAVTANIIEISERRSYDPLRDVKIAASVQIFTHPLSKQRHEAISLELCGVKSLVDVGCGSGDYLLRCMSVQSGFNVFLPNLAMVVGLDVNSANIKTLRQSFLRNVEQNHYNESVERVQLWHGSMLSQGFLQDLRSHMSGSDIDGLVCIEVIEHLPSIEDATNATVSLLAILQPRVAVFTTPNHDANPILSLAAKSCPKKTSKFRETDHKFEFTRREFKKWIDNVLSHLDSLSSSTIKYSPRTFEVGDLSKYCNGSECGGATQGVVFSRQSRATTDILLGDEKSQDYSHDHEHPWKLCLDWNSSSDDRNEEQKKNPPL